MDNHKVVAQWHEIEIGTAELRAKQSEIDKAAGEQKKAIQQFKNEASKAVIEQARSNAADYLIQALIQSRSNDRIEHVLNQAEDKTENGTPGIVLIEAETFNRGNGLRSSEGYGEGIGILISSGPTKVEYDVTVTKAGTYTLHMRYAAQQARPGKLFVNDKLINEKAVGSVTGTWYPDSQTWHPEGTFPLNTGKNVLKFDWSTPTPHIDKLLFMPAEAQGVSETFKTDHLHAAFSEQWTKALKQAAKDAKSPLNEWGAYLDDPLKPIDKAAIEAIRDRFAQAAEGDSLHQLIHKKDGPFKTPKEVEKLFAKADQDKLKQLQAKLGEIEKTRPATPKAMAVREGKVQDLKVHLRGDYMTQGELAPRGYLQVIANKNASTLPKDGSGRAGFAKWLTGDNPLTARVMANRIWLWHFGQGIVRTPDNFGTLGLRPTHPELLDWLALRFVESGWSIKQMHRIIMNSAVYRMSTRFSEEAYAMDPDNKLWWRFNRRRLQAEEVRDSLLVAGDSIEWGVKGQLMTYNPRQYVSQNDHPYFFGSSRTVYLPVIRSGTFDVLQAFDFGDSAVIQGQRTSTVGAAQALFMMNHDLVAKATERLAKRADGNPNLIAAAHQLYADVLRREPSEREAVRSVEFVQRAVGQAEAAPAKATEQAWQSLARVLFSSNEFMFLD